MAYKKYDAYHLGMQPEEVKEALEGGGASALICDWTAEYPFSLLLMSLQSSTTGAKKLSRSEQLEGLAEILAPLCNALKKDITTSAYFKINSNGLYAIMTERMWNELNNFLYFSFTYTIQTASSYKTYIYTFEVDYEGDAVKLLTAYCYTMVEDFQE